MGPVFHCYFPGIHALRFLISAFRLAGLFLRARCFVVMVLVVWRLLVRLNDDGHRLVGPTLVFIWLFRLVWVIPGLASLRNYFSVFSVCPLLCSMFCFRTRRAIGIQFRLIVAFILVPGSALTAPSFLAFNEILACFPLQGVSWSAGRSTPSGLVSMNFSHSPAQFYYIHM